jgi:hypothetical protein
LPRLSVSVLRYNAMKLTIPKAGDIFIDDSVERKKKHEIAEFVEIAYNKLILHVEVKENSVNCL